MYDFIEKSCLIILNTLYHQSIFCVILFILILGLTCLLKQRSPRWLLGLWFLILIRLLMPVDLSSSLSARNLMDYMFFNDNFNISAEKDLDIEEQNNTKALDLWHLDRDMVISWPVILTAAWFLGCLFFLILFLNKIRSINGVLKHSLLLQDKKITSFVNYWRKNLKIRRTVKVFSSDEFLSPFTVGLFRPKIFIPRDLLENTNNETINSIIAHEMVHIKHFDHAWIRLQNILQIIYFFHPAVWHANRQINIARERVCDSIVLAKRVISPKAYGKSIMDVLKLNLTGYRFIESLLFFSNHKKIFEYRIKDIIKGDTMSKQKIFFILLVVFLLGIFLLPMSSGQTDADKSKTSAELKEKQFIKPITGWITSRYGYRISPFKKEKEFHYGIDIAASKGEPIHAAASGTVIKVEFTKLKGHQVILQHSNNYQTYYAQCEKILVKEGQAVKSGDIIATCGSSGRSTGPHLHFELRKDGKPIDPEKYIEFY